MGPHCRGPAPHGAVGLGSSPSRSALGGLLGLGDPISTLALGSQPVLLWTFVLHKVLL